MSDPNMHWDGQRWLRWDGQEWVEAQQPATAPPKSKTGLVIGIIVAAVVVVLALILGIGGFFLLREPITESAGGPDADTTATSITTVPINGTQDSFTDSVGDGQQITPKTLGQPVTVPGGERGLYGGTLNESTCDRRALIAYLTADPAKGQAWAGVLGITYEQIPSLVMKLTPMLLRSDTLVTNHGYRGGKATSFTSVLQAGTAVLVGRRGLPVVRCYCGNPLTPPPAQNTNVRYIGETWNGWNPQSITVVVQNTTLIDTFIVVDVRTGDEFPRPAGTAGGNDGTVAGVTPTPSRTATTQGTQQQIEDVTGFLNAVMSGAYGDADSYTTSGFRASFGGAANLAPGWGALQNYTIDGAYVGDTFVAVYVQEYWEGGYRQSTYYVTKGGGTYIEDADFNDTPGDPYPTEEPSEGATDYPEQYPDESGYPEESSPEEGAYPEDYPTDEAVG